MVRADLKNMEAGAAGQGRRFAWGRAVMKRTLQAAVLFAVAASVPEAWSAHVMAPASAGSVTGGGGGGASLHVNNIPVGTATFATSDRQRRFARARTTRSSIISI